MIKKYSLNLLLLLFILLAAGMTGYTQTGQVTGKITDAADGQTMPGVNVVIKGTTQGTTSDLQGKYTINVGTNTTLVFSFIGYQAVELLVQPNTKVDVILKSAIEEMKEFVVIGYGVQKKRDATGSVSAIESKEFNTGSILNPAELITGKVAGVQITNDGGAPGGSATIRIRGGSSLQASNDPLIVIDGVPVDFEGITGMRNPLSMINPQDIETFTVLKDASATAIYGSRASNGVIIITTKKGVLGQKGKKINLEYSGNITFNALTKNVDILSADEFRQIINEKFPTHVELLGTENTDWQKEIFQNSLGMDHYLSAKGAVKMVPYRLSLGYSDHDGILKTDNYNRTSISGSLTPVFLDDHLKVTVNVNASFANNTFADRGAIGSANQFDPTQPVESDKIYNPYYLNEGDTVWGPPTDYGGYFAWVNDVNDQPITISTANPLALLKLRDDKSDVNRFIGNAQIDYKFHFFPDLRANFNIGTDHSKSDGNVFIPEYASWQYNLKQGGGTKNAYEQEKKNELLDFYLNYVKRIDKIKSTVDMMAGYSWQHFWSFNDNWNTNVLGTVYNDTSDYTTENYLVSFFGRLNYTFNEKYLLTLTLRNDGTSRFSEDNRWGMFPAMAFAWKISDEKFMSGMDKLSQLKLRLGYGITGQQNIGQGDYPYLARYTVGDGQAQYQLGNVFYSTLRPEGYDENIKWEETTTYNAGLDFGFFDDKYYGSIDVYMRKTDDLINLIPIPAGTNLTNYILTNVGNLENKGIEFSIFTRPITKPELNWEVGFNTTYNKNEITKLTSRDDEDYIGYLTGGISGGVGNTIQVHSVGYPTYSFFVYEQVYDSDGKPIQGMYVDRNGDGTITDDDRYRYHKPAADLTFGISSRIDYKNWNFSFSGRANFGNYVYNNVASENGVYERLYRPEGPYLSNIAQYVYETNFENPQYLSDYFIQDASFFRMDNMTLSYLFKKLMNDKIKLRLSATVNNAFVITKYDGLDPEIGSGIDNNIYPRPRTYVFGVNLQF